MDGESEFTGEKLCAEYVADINEILLQCQDIALLDFVLQLLQKSVAKTMKGDSGVA